MSVLVSPAGASAPSPHSAASPDSPHSAADVTRRFLMCPPAFFDVTYRINPWMHPAVPTDRRRAGAQWLALVEAYRLAGHPVLTTPPVDGLPDMVFAANAGLVIGGRALTARFRHPERRGEEAPFFEAFVQLGLETARATCPNEGEGDYLPVRSMILGASGFRTDRRSHREVEDFFGWPVISLELIDARFYHLDTALAVLDDGLIAYWPGAFSPSSRGVLSELFPDAIVATEEDARAFGLNACSDGQRVFLSSGATGLATQMAERGLTPVLIDTSELQKAGGSVKCCTLVIR
jgi:N-dimethylarginine dimethylaminohydrolase